MNNLHRDGPISDSAWAQMEERRPAPSSPLAARRSWTCTARKASISQRLGQVTSDRSRRRRRNRSCATRGKAACRIARSFELSREAIDAVERGANDSDWSPLKEAARKIAFAEDRAVFDGYAAAGIQASARYSNPVLTLPSSVSGYPGAVAQAVSQLRLAGVNDPMRCYWVRPYTAIGERPTTAIRLQHIQRLVTERSFGRRPSRRRCSYNPWRF